MIRWVHPFLRTRPFLSRKHSSLASWDRGGRTAANSLPPLYLAIRQHINDNNGCVCLVQVGSFYELYFEQASEYGPKLGIKVAEKRTTHFTIPMSGFPTYQLQKFVKMLVQDHLASVAIFDQYPDAGSNVIHRKISRIVTPGTLVDETFVNYAENNYLLAISLPPNTPVADASTPVGLSWIDVSVGEFHVQQTTLADVMADIARISPSEIILSPEAKSIDQLTQWWAPLAGLGHYFVRIHSSQYRNLKLSFLQDQQKLRKHLELFSVRETAAMHLAISYVNVNLPEVSLELDLPHQYYSTKYLQMDGRTRDALELTKRQYGGKQSVAGLLLNIIKETVTTSGTRMLTQWLQSPEMDPRVISHRHDHVDAWLNNPNLRLQIRGKLASVDDIMRVLQRLVVGSGEVAANLVNIADTINNLETIRELVVESGDDTLTKFGKKMAVPEGLSQTILTTLHVDVPDDIPEDVPEGEQLKEKIPRNEEAIESTLGLYSNDLLERYRKGEEAPKFAFSVRADFTATLFELHEKLAELKREELKILMELTATLAEIDPKVILTKRPVLGRHVNVIHVSTRAKYCGLIESACAHDATSIREKRKATLLLKPRKWAELQVLMDDATAAIVSEESAIMEDLRQRVVDSVLVIRHLARAADFIDVTLSFAVLAHTQNLIRPKLTKSCQLTIENGRHLVVERGLLSVSKHFHANSTKLSAKLGTTWVISGPNMGGKSTFLRQNAHCVILAQMGCFIPAEKALMLVVDRIFTRIGASDDLFSDLLTFMVEMVELAAILNNATSSSLAIVDEIGRGTSGKEGLAISYATLVSMLDIKCRTLFATHFGPELHELLNEFGVNQQRLRWYRTRVVDKMLDHQLEPGISARSNALAVAKLAGFPKKTIGIATKALAYLDNSKARESN